MINIFIKGLKDGVHDVDIIEPVESVDLLTEEFFGDIKVKGMLRIIGNRFSFTGKAECDAELVCDRTLKKFVESIEADISLSFLVVKSGVEIQDVGDEEKEKMISKEEKYIDITRDVCEELILNIPMKKISPEAEGKDIEEIYPEHSAKKKRKDKDENEIDERWAALKDIKIN